MKSNMLLPSSVELVFTSISGIINLSSFDKQKIASYLKLDKLQQSEVYQSLDGIALAGIGILILIAVCGTAIYITKRAPKLRSILLRINRVIFWNFLIRYF